MIYILKRGMRLKMGKGIFKYIFVIVVISLAIYTGFKLIRDDNLSNEENLDQTSKVSTIQKDLRLSISAPSMYSS